jgi:hypothetical protein
MLAFATIFSNRPQLVTTHLVTSFKATKGIEEEINTDYLVGKKK